MFKNISNLGAGEITQINTDRYRYNEQSTHTTVVREGGRYSNNVSVQISANEVSFVNEALQHEAVPSLSQLRDRLYANVSTGALHNSAERCDAPKCHEQTRIAVQEDIMGWITSGGENPGYGNMLWVTGPAGAGKTAIMGSVAELCQQNGILAGSFFFSSFSKSLDRRTKHRLIPTLAYQIQQHPALKYSVGMRMLYAMADDPGIFDKDLREQTNVLLLKPFREIDGLYDTSLQIPLVILLDGLDECQATHYHDPLLTSQHSPTERSKEDDQGEILSILLQAATDPSFPFRFVIASRPERHIRQFFSPLGPGEGVVKEIFLDDRYNPDADIELFLISKLSQIQRRHFHLPSSWPEKRTILQLVEKASGQFIYAATVIAFIETPTSPPQVQLNCVLRLRYDKGANPLANLDSLYSAILNSAPNPDLAFKWLRSYRLLCLRGRLPADSVDEDKTLYPADPPAWFFDRLSESSAGEADMVMGKLTSLICFPAENNVRQPYSFYHRSFLDFLDDPSRSINFSDANEGTVRWLCERVARCLVCQGPEVPFDEPAHLKYFIPSFFQLWDLVTLDRKLFAALLDQEVLLSECSVGWWILWDPLPVYYQTTVWHNMFVLVHRKCSWDRPCTVLCEKWRRTIRKETVFRSKPHNQAALLMDKLCLRRIQPSTWTTERQEELQTTPL